MRWLMLALVLVGCGGTPTDPGPGDVRFVRRAALDPVPTEYVGWYAEVEADCGVTGNFGAVVWMAADSIFVDGVPYSGHFAPPDTLTVHANYLKLESGVRHLMAHHVLQSEDEPTCGWAS